MNQSLKTIQHRRKLRAAILTIFFVFIILVLLFQLCRSHEQKNYFHHQLITTQSSFRHQCHQHRQLKLNVRQLNNRGYLEQLIRKRYGYAKSGETIYNLPNGE